MLKMIKNLRNLKMSLPIGFFLCFKDVLVKLLKRLFIANIRSSFMQKTGLTGLLLCQLLANYNISGTKIIFFWWNFSYIFSYLTFYKLFSSSSSINIEILKDGNVEIDTCFNIYVRNWRSLLVLNLTK